MRDSSPGDPAVHGLSWPAAIMRASPSDSVDPAVRATASAAHDSRSAVFCGVQRSTVYLGGGSAP